MTTDKRLDEAVSKWLEETAPARLPERVLDATFERTRRSRQRVGWRGLLRRLHISGFASALGGAAAVIVVAAVALGLYANQPGVGGPVPSADPPSPFEGTWVSTSDADGGTQTMTVRVSAEGVVQIVVSDDIASVCSRTPSTMTGTGRLEGSTQLVIPAPVYTCDNGSEPQALSGPPLEEQLRDLTYVHHPETDTLTVGFDSVWRRPGAPEPSRATSPASTASPTPDEGVEPGRYVLEEAGYRHTVDGLTAGWDSDVGWVMVRGDETNDPPDMAFVGLWGDPKIAYGDPCEWSGSEIDTGRTAEDMAAVLAELEALNPSAPADVTVSGYSGKRVVLTVPNDIEWSPDGGASSHHFPQCQSGQYRSYEGRYHQGAGQVDEVWILDVEGDRRVVVIGYFPTTPEEVKAELAQMMESMQIEPAGP